MSRRSTNPIQSKQVPKPANGRSTPKRRKRAPRVGAGYWLSGHPALLKEWHPTLNGELTPDAVSQGSGKRVWWKCSKGPDHEWAVRASNRVAGSGCPACAHRKLSITNCLSTIAPSIAKEWHRKLNGKLTPRKIIAGAARKVWWKCPKGPDHVWQAAPHRRVYEGSGCPFCEGQRVSVTNSLKSTRPDLARELDAKKNAKLKPEEMTAGSTRRVWWRCAKGPDHVWQAMVRARAKMDEGCPFCTLQKVSVSNRLDVQLPSLAAEWHRSRNRPLKPRDVTVGTRRKVWWRCSVDGKHVWFASVSVRARSGTGCPWCNRGGRARRAGVTADRRAEHRSIPWPRQVSAETLRPARREHGNSR